MFTNLEIKLRVCSVTYQFSVTNSLTFIGFAVSLNCYIWERSIGTTVYHWCRPCAAALWPPDILLTIVLDTDTLNALNAGRYSLLSEVWVWLCWQNARLSSSVSSMSRYFLICCRQLLVLVLICYCSSEFQCGHAAGSWLPVLPLHRLWMQHHSIVSISVCS